MPASSATSPGNPTEDGFLAEGGWTGDLGHPSSPVPLLWHFTGRKRAASFSQPVAIMGRGTEGDLAHAG